MPNTVTHLVYSHHHHDHAGAASRPRAQRTGPPLTTNPPGPGKRRPRGRRA